MKKIISNLKIYRIYLYLLTIVIVYFYNVNFTYANKVRVVDGDTIHINNIKYRLHGIDAPEIKQYCQVNGQKYNCGVQSKNFLESLIENKEITCKQKNIDKYKRIIATCYTEELNLNFINLPFWTFQSFLLNLSSFIALLNISRADSALI